MTGMFRRALRDGDNIIGRETKEYIPDIKINGVGIANHHCTISFDSTNRLIYLHPNSQDPGKYSTKVNGKSVEGEPV